MPKNSRNIAIWRFEQISPLLDETLTAAERQTLIRQISRTFVLWPSGRTATVSRSSLGRWRTAYLKNPQIETLMPKKRKSTKGQRAIECAWNAFALAKLEENPERSMYFLCVEIQRKFHLDKPPSRASLHRALKTQSRYRALRRRAKVGVHLRGRFQAKHPHQIWQADAKGAFRVLFADGTTLVLMVLSMLDDCTRFLLRARIIKSESEAEAITTFRQAAARWGLPDGLYADRGSCYDSNTLRDGLAMLGTRRIDTKARNAPAHGKIEAFHRTLKRWFVKELKYIVVRDLDHLQQLLDDFAERYNDHPHRQIKQTPALALDGRLSKRVVSPEQLRNAFLLPKDLAVERNTGNVCYRSTPWRLPEALRLNKRVTLLIDPQCPETPMVRLSTGLLVTLSSAIKDAGSSDRKRLPTTASLAPVTVQYRGRTLPKAHPGFGLPEIYELLSQALGRSVPATDREAQAVVALLKFGPFEPRSFQKTLDRVGQQLGEGRPLALILKALETRITKPKGVQA